MTKVDERAQVPPVDAAARERLARALDRPEVLSALLFGSQATCRASALSDVDVAVWIDPAIGRDARWELTSKLMSAAAEALGSDEVQVVLLNDAPPLLAHRAIRDGIRLLDRDPVKRIRLETRAVLDYLDTAPLRATLAAGLRRRIDEGRFARR
jgi:predicted nucleotidyltransferase